MGVRRSRFQPPPQFMPRAPAKVRQEILEPILGLNTSTAPQNLQPGQTPAAQNYDVDDRTLRMRSGISRWGSVNLGTDKALGAARFSDALGTSYTLVLSDATASVRTNDTTNWTQLTAAPNSSATTAYYSFAYGYAATLDDNIVIAVDGIRQPEFWSPVLSSWSTLGNLISHESFAKYATFFDNRAVFFNTGSRSTLPYTTRVRWSQRGNPLEYTAIDAGFEDLVDMQGVGTGIFVEGDRMVLFSDKETWIARSRRDEYVFEFFPLARNVGNPYPRSAAVTDKGVIWLDNEFRFRLLSGNAVYTFNDATQHFLKDTLREPGEVWAAFNPAEGMYQFNFSDTTGQYPSRALWLRTDSISADERNPNELQGVWMPQDFGSYQFSAGEEELMVASKGTSYRLRSNQTTDDSVGIDARWRSHAMRLSRDPDAKETLTEAWVDYNADSNGSISLFFSNDLGATFSAAGVWNAVSGEQTAFLPFTTAASRYKQIEVRQSDGQSVGITNIRMTLRQYTGRF